MRRVVHRVLCRLLETELAESDVWFKTDIRQAYITLAFASRGERNPADLASRITLGLPLTRVWEEIVRRRRAILGPYYEQFYDANGRYKPDAIDLRANPVSLVPKKPPASVRLDGHDERRAVAGAGWFPERTDTLKAKRRGRSAAPFEIAPKPPRMATSPQVYRNSDVLHSGFNPPLSTILHEIDRSSVLTPSQRVTAKAYLMVFYQSEGAAYDSDDEIFPAYETVAQYTRVHRDTVKRHIHKMRANGLEIFKEKYGPNQKRESEAGVRRPATYNFMRGNLRPIPWKSLKKPRSRHVVADAEPVPIPPQSVKVTAPPPAPPPVEKSKTNGQNGEQPRLPKSDRDRLTQEFVAVLRGKTLHNGECFLHPESGVHQPTPDSEPRCWKCYSLKVEHNPPKIEVPMALAEACRRLNIPIELGIETYKLGKLPGVYGDYFSHPRAGSPGGNDS
jgi:hypothetical protein